MAIKQTIIINWWDNNHNAIPADSEFDAILQQAADKKISEMRLEGLTSGDLYYQDLNSDFQAFGFWAINTKRI